MCWQDWRMTDDIACGAIKQMVLLLILRVGKTLRCKNLTCSSHHCFNSCAKPIRLLVGKSLTAEDKWSNCKQRLSLQPHPLPIPPPPPPPRRGSVVLKRRWIHSCQSSLTHAATSSKPYSSLSLATSISPTHLFKTQVYTTSPLPERRMDSTVSWQRPRPHAVRSTRSSQTRPGPAR